MKSKYLDFLASIDVSRLMGNTERLLKHEICQTFDGYHASADEAVKILQENGIPNIEKLTFPADGKTAYQDKLQPLGWTATKGKLTILSGRGIEPGFVAADFQAHPFHLVKGSCSTAPEGETVRVITLEQALMRKDLRGYMVMRNQLHTPGCRELPRLLDMGARGVITDFAMNSETERDGIQWNNAFTERNNWHVTKDDRPFIAYCVTPAVGEKLRKALAYGELTAKIESDARRYETTVDLVTAMVPGRRKEEFWIFAHLYEPLSNDNSAGVACAIETARQIMMRGTPEFSLRVLFGLEHYGFAEYAAHRGDKNLSSEVIGGIDYDAMYLRNDWYIHFNVAAPGTPFYGNYLLRMLAQDINGLEGVPDIQFKNSFPSMYDDDSFLSDSSTGVPTVWPFRKGQALWHNSKQTMDYLHPDAFRTCCAINTTFTNAVISPDAALLERLPEQISQSMQEETKRMVGSQLEHLTRRRDILAQDLENFTRCFKPEQIQAARERLQKEYEELTKGLSDEIEWTPLRRQLETIVPRRLTVGFPFDQAKVPASERIILPGSILYCPMAAMLANMDGMRNMAEITRMVEHETCAIITEDRLEDYVHAFQHLAKYGYIEWQNKG
ncbi:MAG: M28 family peptidase [Victivallales bacterium]|nr:M28 family peptidase [Victivallales bacterium]